MMDVGVLYQRFTKDSLSVRLGGVASDLARLATIIRSKSGNSAVLENVLCETKLFSEWAAVEASFDVQLKILELQRFLVHLNQHELRPPALTFADELNHWSDDILNISGLIPNG